jgi:dolichol-phosphate mannosyltransferase
MSSVKIPMDTGDFRLIDRKVVDALRKMPEHNRFLRGMSSWIGFKQIPLEYERCERFAGETKYPFKKMMKLAMDGIISFSSKPLKLIEYLGLGITLISFALLIYSLIVMSEGVLPGSTPILTLLLFIGGIQLLSIGIVGEYIARIYDESKDRPLYVIDREINFEENAAKPIYIVENPNPELDNLQKII